MLCVSACPICRSSHFIIAMIAGLVKILEHVNESFRDRITKKRLVIQPRREQRPPELLRSDPLRADISNVFLLIDEEELKFKRASGNESQSVIAMRNDEFEQEDGGQSSTYGFEPSNESPLFA